MGRPEQVSNLYLQGKTIQQIALTLRISEGSVFKYMYQALPKAGFTLLDIVFAIDPAVRDELDLLYANGAGNLEDSERAKSSQVTDYALKEYWLLRERLGSAYAPEKAGTSPKTTALGLIGRLPDNVSLEDIVYELYVRQKIERGLQESNEGKTIPNTEVMREMRDWLRSTGRSARD
jgi:hypothetical protein